MGMVPYGALSTLVTPDKNLLMRVPESWSLEEAATVPVVYGTVIYALKLVSKHRLNVSGILVLNVSLRSIQIQNKRFPDSLFQI